MSKSSIEWTDETWNPTTGCDRVSPGCAHCYALDLAARLKAMGQPRYQRDGDPKTSGPGFGLTLHPDKLDEPLRWRKPRMVFVNSMSDLFHEEIPDEFIDRVFQTMLQAERHTFQILTKRPERAKAWFAEWWQDGFDTWEPLPNVWLGVSIENSRYTWRADVLREIPAAVRFISAEPLLGSLFEAAPPKQHKTHDWQPIRANTASAGIGARPGAYHCPRCDAYSPTITLGSCPGPQSLGLDKSKRPLDLTGIDWLIVGGESGPEYRPMNLDHARELRDACLRLREPDAEPIFGETAFFFKQVGGRTPKSGGRLLDGHEWNEMPTVREAVAA